jgi:hypothetical protein
MSLHAAEIQASTPRFYANPGWTYAFEGDSAFYNDPDGPNPNYLDGDDANLPGGRNGTAALVDPGFVSPGVVDNARAPWLFTGSGWDGSAPGDPLGGVPGSLPPLPPAAPGGVGAFNDGGVSFLRFQDAGQPRDWGWPNKNTQAGPGKPRQEGNNFRIGVAHPLNRDAGYSGDQFLLNTGVTLTFRTRIATAATGPLDSVYPEGGPSQWSTPQPWPTSGVGYPIGNDGRGIIDISHGFGATGRQLAFGLVNSPVLQFEGVSSTISKTGLVLNNRATGPLGGDPDTDRATPASLNIVAFSDEQLTQWQEFWVTIQALPAAIDDNTHEVRIYANGSLEPQVFQTVLSGENQHGVGGPAIGLGVTSGTRFGGFDLDYVAYREGVILPSLVFSGDFNRDGTVSQSDLVVWEQTFGDEGPDLAADGDADGIVGGADLLQWQRGFGSPSVAAAATAQVPEPAALALGSVSGIVAALRRRRPPAHAVGIR